MAPLDRNTRELLDSLEDPGASFLALLADGPATEADLVRRARAAQPTANRRLDRLQELGLIERPDRDRKQAPNRPWALVHASETVAVLEAAIALSEKLAEVDAATRSAARRQLRRARARETGLRRIDRDEDAS